MTKDRTGRMRTMYSVERKKPGDIWVKFARFLQNLSHEFIHHRENSGPVAHLQDPVL